MTRTEARDRVGWFGDRLDAHHSLPVHRVAVHDLERERRASGPPLTHAAGDAHRIALDALPRATAVSELPAAQVEIDLRRRHCETGGDAVQDGEDHRPVGLAGGQEPHTRRGRAARMTSSGAGTPVQSSNERAA